MQRTVTACLNGPVRSRCQRSETPHRAAVRNWIVSTSAQRQHFSALSVRKIGMETALGNFFFRSRFSDWLWNTHVGSPSYFVRLLGAVAISLILVGRSYRLFIFTRLANAPVLGILIVGALWGGLGRTAVAGLLAGTGYLFWLQASQPTVNVGHRAGGQGFKGPQPENTLEALRDLIRGDKEGPLKDLHYVEFDVHETRDGELVVLHDLRSVLAASADAERNATAVKDLLDSGLDLQHAKVEDVTLAQLKALHLGGHEGVRIPTLAEFLRCCKEEGLERSVAVEVKAIHTEGGRTKFLDLLREYKEEHCRMLESTCPDRKYVPFGWIAAISFPFLWCPSFGEFCSPLWKEWAAKFRAAGIPVRSCVLHSLDLVPAPC